MEFNVNWCQLNSTQLNEHVRTQVLTPQCPHLFNATTYETTHLLLHVLIYLQFRSGRLCNHTRYRITSKNFDLGFTKIRDILRPGETQAGTWYTGPEIRDVPGNMGRLATLVTVRGTLALCINDVIATRDFCTSVRAVAQNSPPIHSNWYYVILNSFKVLSA